MAENDTKKWIFIGCGGCLGILVLVGILLAIGGAQLFGKLQEGSNKSAQAVFGESYKVPSQYTPLGMTVGEGAQAQSFITLLDMKNQRAVIAMKMPVDEAASQALTSNDPNTIKQAMDKMAVEMQESSSKSQSGSRMEEMQVDDVHVMQIANGKMVPVAYLRGKEDGKETPGAMVAVVQNDHTQVVLMGMAQAAGTDAEAFKKAQQDIEDELLNVMQASEIDDRIP